MIIDNDPGTEAERIDEWAEAGFGVTMVQTEEAMDEFRDEVLPDMVARYDRAFAAKTGDRVVCPSCTKVFVKKTYQQRFCRNKGRGNCKDRYHNMATETRWSRTKDEMGISE